MSIIKKFIGADQVDGAKLLLLNNQALRAKEAGGAAVDILKVTSGDVLEIQKLPRVSSSAPAVSDDKDLVTKEYLDGVLGGGSGEGYAPLVSGKIPNQYYSSLVITDVFVVANIAARDALTEMEEGDVAKVTDAGNGLPKTYIYGGSSWIEIESGSDVDTVNGYTGTVILQTSDIAENGATNRYYTPTRQSSIEAYADQAEADAITSANSYTDGEISTLQGALEAEDLTFLKLDGSRPMEASLDMGNFDLLNAGDVNAAELHTSDGGANSANYGPGSIQAFNAFTIDSSGGITLSSMGNPLQFSAFSTVSFGGTVVGGVSDGVAADDAATKGQLDALETSLQLYTDNAVEAEQLARVAEDLTFVKLDGSRALSGDLPAGSHKITGLAVGTVSSDAATYGQVQSAQSAAEATAQAYTDGQFDLLSVQQIVHESKTLGAGDLTSISVAHAIQGQPWIQVGRVSLVPGDDFTVSGSTITWAGSVAPAGAEALEAGDKVSIFYMKAVQPYV